MYCQRKSNTFINRIHERALRIAYNDYLSDFNSLLAKDDSVTIPHRNIQALTIIIIIIFINYTLLLKYIKPYTT